MLSAEERREDLNEHLFSAEMYVYRGERRRRKRGKGGGGKGIKGGRGRRDGGKEGMELTKEKKMGTEGCCQPKNRGRI